MPSTILEADFVGTHTVYCGAGDFQYLASCCQPANLENQPRRLVMTDRAKGFRMSVAVSEIRARPPEGPLKDSKKEPVKQVVSSV
jgi:hypothetical protein